jgi:hypothetical protein
MSVRHSAWQPPANGAKRSCFALETSNSKACRVAALPGKFPDMADPAELVQNERKTLEFKRDCSTREKFRARWTFFHE